MTKRQRLKAATLWQSTGGLVPEVDTTRRDEVVAALVEFLAPVGQDVRQEVRGALDWLEQYGRLSAGRDVMPEDVRLMVRDLERLDYVARVVMETRTGSKAKRVALSEELRDAAADRVQRWLDDSAARRQEALLAKGAGQAP
jgi:hypothetical protein